MSSSSEPNHRVREPQRLVARRVGRVRERDHAHPRPPGRPGCRCPSPPPRWRPPGAAPSRLSASRYTSGAGLPRSTSSDDTVTLEAVRQAAQLEEEVDDLPVGGRRQAQRPALRRSAPRPPARPRRTAARGGRCPPPGPPRRPRSARGPCPRQARRAGTGDHSGELMPIMSRGAESLQRPPRSVDQLLLGLVPHLARECSSTPSRSNTTASVTPCPGP